MGRFILRLQFLDLRVQFTLLGSHLHEFDAHYSILFDWYEDLQKFDL
jgi:hypothetical protein